MNHMISKAVGAVSVLYFIYLAYFMILSSGLFGILALLYYLPYPIAGILLLMGEHRMIAALCGVVILIIPFYLSGYNISVMIGNLINPIYLVFSVVLPVLIVYSAIKD